MNTFIVWISLAFSKNNPDACQENAVIALILDNQKFFNRVFRIEAPFAFDNESLFDTIGRSHCPITTLVEQT